MTPMHLTSAMSGHHLARCDVGNIVPYTPPRAALVHPPLILRGHTRPTRPCHLQLQPLLATAFNLAESTCCVRRGSHRASRAVAAAAAGAGAGAASRIPVQALHSGALDPRQLPGSSSSPANLAGCRQSLRPVAHFTGRVLGRTYDCRTDRSGRAAVAAAAAAASSADSNSPLRPFQEPPGAEREEALDLGPATDLLSAMDTLSYVRTFSQLSTFLESNSRLFGGPEVAAVVLQAANVSELASQRQLAAAMEVVERRAAALESSGEAGEGGLTSGVLADTVNDWLRSATPSGSGVSGGDDDMYGNGILVELEAAERVMAWATPILCQHIKRYPPDAVMALVSALAQLDQYDSRLMELVSERFKADPETWIRRAAPGFSPVAGEEGVYGSDFGGSGGYEGAVDPWVVLVALARAFARLGHYDPDVMSALAKQAVKLLPEVAERAEREELHTVPDGGGGGAVDTVVLLVSSYLELNHLDPGLMQAAGELLASFGSQLDCAAAAEVLLTFAAFVARNPPFYELMLRRVLEAPPETLSPRAAGLLYRACVLISATGDVPALTPAAIFEAGDANPSTVGQDISEAGSKPDSVLEPVSDEDRQVAAALAALLRSCLSVFPVSELSGTYLARPSPEQLEEADEGLLAAWDATGLLAAPQVLAALQELAAESRGPDEGGRAASLELLPLEALAPPPPSYGTGVVRNHRAEDSGGEGEGEDDGSGKREPVVGGANAPAWVPADALLLYDMYQSGSVRIAIKVLDDRRHCCPGPVVQPSTQLSAVRSTTSSASTGMRLRGQALSELRCLEVWGWRVLVVPVGLWAGLGEDQERVEWLRQRLQALAETPEAAPVGPVLRL